MFCTWLVAYDFDDTGDAAAEAAATLADGQAIFCGDSARVVLCHVVERPRLQGISHVDDEDDVFIEDEEQRLIERAAALALQHPHLKIASALRVGATVPALLDEAQRQHADVIAVGCHDNGLVHALMRSVPERTVHRARTPVFVVKVPLPRPPLFVAY